VNTQDWITATADSRMNRKICAVIRISSSECLIVGLLLPCKVSRRCPAIMFAVSVPVRIIFLIVSIKKKRTPWPESASELYRPSDRRLSAK
jgi:hypothetical protein